MAMQQIGLTLAIAVGYFFLGILSLAHLHVNHLHVNHYVAGFWLPSGFVVALAIQRGYRTLPGIWLGEMALGLSFNHGPLWMPVAVDVSHCLQGVTVCLLAPRLIKGRNIFISLPNLSGFLVTALVGCTVHTLLGGWLIPQLAGQNSLPFNWFIGGFSGVVVLAPLLLSWFSRPDQKPKLRRTELAGLLVGAVVGVRLLNWEVLEDVRGLWLVVYTCFLIWGAFRFTPPIATAINVYLVTLFLLMPPNIWVQTFNLAPKPIRAINTPILLTTYLIVALVILVVNGDRQRITQELQIVNKQLREKVTAQATELDVAQAELAKTALSITEAIPIGTYTMVLPPDQDMAHFAFMSERFLQIAGLERSVAESNPLQAFDCVHPDDRADWIALNVETFAQKIPFCAETRLVVAGNVRWVRAESVPRALADGSTVWEGVLVDITETKRYEQRLQDAHAEIIAVNQTLEDRVKARTTELETSRAKFQRLVEDIGDNFVIFSHTGEEGIVTYVSGGFEAIFGCDLNRILGQSWTTTVNWFPDSLALAEREVGKLIAGDTQTQQFEMDFTRLDGEQRTIQVIQHPVYDQAGNLIAVEGLTEDITKQKQFITTLAASEAKFRTFIETANDLIYSLDPEGCFTYFSPNAVDILGTTPAELNNLNFSEIVHPDDFASCLHGFNTVMSGQRIRRLEYRVRHKDGSWRWHSSSASPQFDDKKNVVAVVGFAHDFTDRKLAELKQQALNRELLKANQLKDEFLAMMSHELRTPLNAVLGMTESLQEEIFGPLNDRQQSMLQVIQDSGSHLLSLINDILDLSKMEAGQMKLTIKPTAAQALSEASLQFIQPQALKKQIQLLEQIPPRLPDLQVDERRIRQVLINLLTNAVKFTPEGGAVTVSAALISPAVGLKYSQIRLEVRDTGIGISPENLQQLFKPFIQIDSALNRNYGGTGLGLSLVKSIVELHDGEVGVSSEEGVGSCFWFTVPCVATPLDVMAEQVDDSDPIDPDPNSPAIPSVFSPPKTLTTQPILLVARDLKCLISIDSYLTAKGYPVKVVTMARAIAAGIEESPQCLVLVLEQGNDPEFLTLIHSCRQCAPLSQTPIIVTLPNGQEKIDPQPYLAAGANHYLAPSLKLRDLANCIRQLTGY